MEGYIDTMALLIYMFGDNKHLKPTKTLTTSHASMPHAVCLQRLVGCQLHAWPWCNSGDRAIPWGWSMSLVAAQSTESDECFWGWRGWGEDIKGQQAPQEGRPPRKTHQFHMLVLFQLQHQRGIIIELFITIPSLSPFLSLISSSSFSHK